MPTAKADDERAPLLAVVSPAPIAEPVPETSLIAAEEEEDNGIFADDDTPLPRLQIFLLCYTRVVEPIAFFSIFPYINAMIEKVGGVDKEDVGFYSGLIESLFSLTQMCVMLFWGRVCQSSFCGSSCSDHDRLLIDMVESRSLFSRCSVLRLRPPCLV